MRGRVTTISKILILMMIIILAGFGCKDELTVVSIKTIFLKGEDVGVTDALLHITITSDKTPSNFSLKQDGRTIFTGSSHDTTILCDALLPKHTYTYKAYRLYGATAFDSSDALTITTMDTTSHNFMWELDTLGDGNSSVLYDVAIINDTLAYAVGEIYKQDSLGNWDSNAYNMVKWDGKNWELTRIYTYSSCSAVDFAPLKSIVAFSDSNIVVTSGGGIWMVRGNKVIPNCGINPLLTGAINKLWGTSSNDIYAVGNKGNIIHYNGSSWQKLESGTSTDIMDAWGAFNPSTNRTEVYCAVTSFWTPQDKKILKIISPSTVDSVTWNTGRDVVSVWTPNGFPQFTAGDGVYENHTGNWREMNIGTSIYTNRIRGNARNDVVVIGDYGLIAHYNGLSWRVVQLNMTSFNGYGGLAVNNHLVVVVGGDVSRAIIAMGKRE